MKVKVPVISEASKKRAMDLFIDGKVAESKKQLGDAVAAYMEALQFDSQSSEIALSLSEVFWRSGKFRSALHYVELAVKLDPSSSQAWFRLQQFAQHKGDFKRAAEALEIYMKLTPEKEFTDVIKLAHFYFSMGKKDKAKSLIMSNIKRKDIPAYEMAQAAEIMNIHGQT
ncbi:unnamed protein product, partial [marine sediment metagenome]